MRNTERSSLKTEPTFTFTTLTAQQTNDMLSGEGELTEHNLNQTKVVFVLYLILN